MKTSFFCTNRYLSREALGYPEWPVPPGLYEPDVGLRSLEESFEQVRLAEESGFDWISCSEHHYTPLRQTPNAVLFAAALSQVVRRAKIAVLGPLVSMNNPVRIAEEIAMLDQLTGGRLIVMFLRGTPNEFLSYGVDPDETRARTQEASVLITRALTEAQPFGWEGRFYRFRTISVWPGPIQRPHPPIFYSGNSFESASFAAARRMGLGVSFYPPHLVAQVMAHYRQECAKHGWQPLSEQMLYRAFIGVGEDEDEAATLQAMFFSVGSPRQLFRGRGAAVPPPAPPVPVAVGTDADGKNAAADKGAIGFALGALQFCGSPDTVVRQITEFHETTGVGVIDLSFAGPGLSRDQTTKSIRLFGTEVLPRIRHIGASGSSGKQTALAAASS
jgi:alkanesulfonate monooxygenase SsuD/methylene tetrahydromethanopterin reductase-like flavin-dependent oxidoreductase (luciferase family)